MIITSMISNYDHENDNHDNVIIDQDDALPLCLMMSIKIIIIFFQFLYLNSEVDFISVGLPKNPSKKISKMYFYQFFKENLIFLPRNSRQLGSSYLKIKLVNVDNNAVEYRHQTCLFAGFLHKQIQKIITLNNYKVFVNSNLYTYATLNNCTANFYHKDKINIK